MKSFSSSANRSVFRPALLAATFVGFGSVSAMSSSQTSSAMADPAFEACASDMDHLPANAYESCAEYVRETPSESSANIARAKDWLQIHAVYRPYVRYLKSLTSDDNASFLVYRPDMSIDLPQVNQADEFGSIKIERKFANTAEEAMLRE